jgi:hypothetical protein
MPVTIQGREAASAALAARRADQPKQIDDAQLPAGSPMHFYCISCGHLAAQLPESYTQRPPKLCGECAAMKELGWLE